jgi:membrane-associated phospholipid phosphatase
VSLAVPDAVVVAAGRVPDWRTVDRFTAARLLWTVLAILLLDLLWSGPLVSVDARIMTWSISRYSRWRPLLHIPDGIGLRAVTAPILVLAALLLSCWARTWRPLLLALGAIATLNAVVAVMKLVLARGMPASGNPEIFAGGMAWPSGHASNVAMTMAMLVYLAGRYGGWHLSPRNRLLVLTGPTGVMCAASVVLGYHWLSDLVAGVAIGLLVALAIRGLDDGPRRDGGRSSPAETQARARQAAGSPAQRRVVMSAKGPPWSEYHSPEAVLR